ncbi:MAG TPA: hypothetical protein VFB37_07165, partial [Steroidobacteraceae bacterium]|nr:hypothetical protein [Steroidobacteraceae bacterium]
PAQRVRRPPRPKPGLVIAESAEHEGFRTRDVLAALRGVTLALDMHFQSLDIEPHELATAARVLAAILYNRAF